MTVWESYNFLSTLVNKRLYLYITLSFSLSLSICLSVSLSIFFFLYLPSLFLSLYVGLSLSLSLSLSHSLSLYLSLAPSLSFFPSLCISVFFSIFLSLSLYLSLYLHLSLPLFYQWTLLFIVIRRRHRKQLNQIKWQRRQILFHLHIYPIMPTLRVVLVFVYVSETDRFFGVLDRCQWPVYMPLHTTGVACLHNVLFHENSEYTGIWICYGVWICS